VKDRIIENWEVLPEEVDKDYIRVRGGDLGLRYKIANVLHPTGVHCARETAQTRRNARLIAAAPELLRVLEEIVNAGTWYPSALEIKPSAGSPDGEDLKRMAMNVITKARGE
jgi:hypothetical protein